MPQFDIVVSTENNPYMAWQAMLFHYSCVFHLGQAPIVVVHKGDEALLAGFERIAAIGGTIQTAPDYRLLDGVNYPPRNTAATLRFVQSAADYLVLCDPDMIFLKPLPLATMALKSRQISFDGVTYLDPDRAIYQPALDDVCRRVGIAPSVLRQRPIRGGVPHVIPAGLQQPLSAAWLENIQLFPTIGPWPAEVAGALTRGCHMGPQKDWLATMWAVVLAVHQLGLEPVMTDWCVSNHEGHQRQLPTGPTGPTMVHYCYADAGFSKHAFESVEAAESGVWKVAEDDGTVSGAIRGQLRAAGRFFRQ